MARVNRLVLTTLADLVRSAVSDPRVKAPAMVSLVKVAVTPDLANAKVYVSVAGDAEEQNEALGGLRNARKFLRSELGRRVRLRRTPELSFELDTTGESAARVEGILRELEAQRSESTADFAAGESAELDQILPVINNSERLLLTTHRKPDGDAIGSLVACLWALEGLDKEVVAFSEDPVPQVFSFLEGTERIVPELPTGRHFDATVVLDCADEQVLPAELMSYPGRGSLVVIDHHKRGKLEGQMVWRDPGAASVGVMLYRLVERLGVHLTAPIAEALYCSVLADTGSFRYQNTNSEAMTVAGKLLDQGVSPWRVASRLYETRPANQVELLALVLQTLCLSDDGLTAVLTITEEMLAQTGCSPDMDDGFVNYARGIEGVQVAALLRVQPDRVRVSMRSRGEVDVSAVAQRFGGGGHAKAAGCTLVGETVEQWLPRLFAQVRRATSDPQS